MRSFLYIVTACTVIALAFWAYRENYATQESLSKTERLQRDIGAARARLKVLKAEWAYLNRPERLRDLADINYARLNLSPFRPDQFGKIAQVTFPEEEALEISQPVDVSTMNRPAGERP